MSSQNECYSINRSVDIELRETLKCDFSSTDDSSDSDGGTKKRMWKGKPIRENDYLENKSKNRPSEQQISLSQKFKPYGQRKISLSINNKHFTSGYGDLKKNLHLTTIELRNVTEETNILQLYKCFSQFGEITLIQIDRNGESRALISFKNSSEASRAMEKASSVISDINVSWFVDYCLLKQFPKRFTTKNKEFCFLKHHNITHSSIFKLDKTMGNISNSKKLSNVHDVINSISKLIKLKNKLLFEQLKSRNEIADKLDKCVPGSDEEKLLLNLLKRIQEQINDNQRSIERSLKQKVKYYSNVSAPILNGKIQDFRRHRSRSWMEVFNDSRGRNEEHDANFIPVNLLDFGISFDNNDEFLLKDDEAFDGEIDGAQNYFTSRSYNNTVNIFSPKKS